MNPEQWRSQMGQGLKPWVNEPGMSHEVTDTSWSLLSGLPSPDMNMVLLWGDGGEPIVTTMAGLDRRDLPALVMLAAEAKAYASAVGDGWQHVGGMPIMQIGLSAAERGTDPRVRLAGREDAETVTSLISEAFGMPSEVVQLCAAPLLHPSETMQIWLLEDGEQAVSAVTGTFVGETFSVWCMSTPERFARRGYGRALLAAVLEEARGRGATVGLLGATPAGLPLYESTGWTTFETWDIYSNAASAQFQADAD